MTNNNSEDYSFSPGEALRKRIFERHLKRLVSPEEMDFMAAAISVAENECGVSVSDPVYRADLFGRYKSAGCPELDGWLHDTLKADFKSLAGQPRWDDAGVRWPFHKGMPMVFAGELDMPACELLGEPTRALLFLASEPEEVRTESGLRMGKTIVNNVVIVSRI